MDDRISKNIDPFEDAIKARGFDSLNEFNFYLRRIPISDGDAFLEYMDWYLKGGNRDELIALVKKYGR